MHIKRWLKVFTVLQVVYLLFCLSSIALFAVNRYGEAAWAFSVANVLVPFWALNPVGLLSLAAGIWYLIMRGDPELSRVIGRKWLWFVGGFLFDVLLFLACGVLLVLFTGGV